MKIFLFDIDGTIMLSGGAGLRAMERAFEERYRIPNSFAEFHFQGKVDPAIFREALVKHNLPVADPDQEIRALITKYEQYIAEEMPRSTKAILYPGVKELILALTGCPGVSIGLLTGNVIGGARAKLSHFDLWRYFPYGAFGSDEEIRSRLVPIALERASRHLGTVVRPGRDVYIIGDTDRDIATAKDNGCTAVGVGTLNFSAARLAELGADIVFENFADTKRVLQTLGVADERTDRALSENPRFPA
ncbi:MAG: HAD hydrolase-like protein [Myxococcales bacterium]|nr:HAD hydrolase-like protein [Myxococcales bacterium]